MRNPILRVPTGCDVDAGTAAGSGISNLHSYLPGRILSSPEEEESKLYKIIGRAVKNVRSALLVDVVEEPLVVLPLWTRIATCYCGEGYNEVRVRQQRGQRIEGNALETHNSKNKRNESSHLTFSFPSIAKMTLYPVARTGRSTVNTTLPRTGLPATWGTDKQK